jgi:hypothetical protein
MQVTFEDIVMLNTGTGIRMKSERGRGGVVEGVTYRNIDMQKIEGQCIQVTLNYHAGLAPTNKTATPVFRDILLENVTCLSGKNSFNIDGLPEQSIAGLVLKNVTMRSGVGGETKCDFVDCSCDAHTVPCPSCCKAHPTPPTPPTPKLPTPSPPTPTPPKHACHMENVLGCFDDGDPSKIAVRLRPPRMFFILTSLLPYCCTLLLAAGAVDRCTA